MAGDLLAGLRRLVAVLDELSISYMIGGSVASSMLGVSRTTHDVDLVVDLPIDRIPSLVAALGPDFHADPLEMRQMLLLDRAFNLIHYPTAFKFDLFPVHKEPFHQTAFGRRFQMPLDQDGFRCWVCTPEDTILNKLIWYRRASGGSARQWSDVTAMLRVRQGRLDDPYLDHWAAELNLTELLERARIEAHA